MRRKADAAERHDSLEKTKQKLCGLVTDYIDTHGLTQRQLAEKMDIDESIVSKMLHMKTDAFTTDFLVKRIRPLYPHLELTISTH